MSQLKINCHELLQLNYALNGQKIDVERHSFQNIFLNSDFENESNIEHTVTQSYTCCKLGWKLLHTSATSQITKFIWLELNLILNNLSRETDPEMILKCSPLHYYEMIPICSKMFINFCKFDINLHQSTFTNVKVLYSRSEKFRLIS